MIGTIEWSSKVPSRTAIAVAMSSSDVREAIVKRARSLCTPGEKLIGLLVDILQRS